MKFVNPSVEYWEQAPGMTGVWSQIAKATRVCYQSQQRKDERDEDFVNRVILKPALIAAGRNEQGVIRQYDLIKMHGAMLEHGTVYLAIPADIENSIVTNTFILDNYSNYKYDIESEIYWVTTNMRVIIENDFLNILKYQCEPNEHHARRYTFSVITDIGVTREMNRHRTFSIAEQSTRYCDFNKDEFGGGLTFIKPAWWKDTIIKDAPNARMIGMFDDIESCYKFLRRRGWKPEQARQVLPLGLKTQAVYTAFENDWEHFLRLRADNASGKVHPNMAVVANMIKDKLYEINNHNNN